jgi:uncharacterized protein with PQ loop repeat
MELLGWLCTTAFGVCYWPQLWHSYKTKSVGDISPLAWVIQLSGYTMGLFYGIGLHEWPLIVGYVHGFLCTGVFLVMYFKYRGNNNVSH